jgi:hypothetical protein
VEDLPFRVDGGEGFGFLGPATPLYTGGAFALRVIRLFFASIRTFHREDILTRWK